MTTGALNPTSYFSTPATSLDPELFDGRALKPWVRQGILTLLHDHLHQFFRHADLWSHPWLAGSGVSYQWSANRQPGDLDCLVGIDYTQFRKANPEFRGLSDREISEHLNEGFRSSLEPKTENWNGYELTFYVNPGATDIRAIKPYAAYDLKYNEWTVTPSPTQSAPANASWSSVSDSDRAMTTQIMARFTQASQDLSTSRGGPAHRNAENRLLAAASQGNSLFDEIHLNRTQAFSSEGEGYSDFHNYRWQAGKRNGTIQDLREIRKHYKSTLMASHQALYGAELPDANTLIRRAALHGK